MFMPSAPPPETLAEFQAPGKLGQFNIYRPNRGSPPFNQPDTRSLVWLRDRSGRPLDALHLAYSRPVSLRPRDGEQEFEVSTPAGRTRIVTYVPRERTQP